MTQTLSDNLADPNCPDCGGGGYRRRDQDSIAPINVETCHCVLRRRAILNIARRLIATELPGLYAEAEIDKLNEREGKVVITDVARGRSVEREQSEIDRENKAKLHVLAAEEFRPGQNVILIGPPGVGKTYSAAALMRDQIRRFGKFGFYITSYRYITTMRPEHASVEEQQRLRKRCTTVDVLLLDDLGIEKNSAATMRELLYLIDERSKNGKATIVTSNLRMAEVFGQDAKRSGTVMTPDTREAYDIGARIYSRFKEDRSIIEWPPSMTDWRDENNRRREAARTLTSDRASRAKAHLLGEGGE
jgi:DNA replication protein DnaC